MNFVNLQHNLNRHFQSNEMSESVYASNWNPHLNDPKMSRAFLFFLEQTQTENELSAFGLVQLSFATLTRVSRTLNRKERILMIWLSEICYFRWWKLHSHMWHSCKMLRTDDIVSHCGRLIKSKSDWLVRSDAPDRFHASRQSVCGLIQIRHSWFPFFITFSWTQLAQFNEKFEKMYTQPNRLSPITNV